jgi:hypothetical protein
VEHRRSLEASRRHDGVPSSDAAFARIRDASDNGASAEAVGSHSLMAKDSPAKEPLRPEAVRVATRAAVYVGQKMGERVGAPSSDAGSAALDWLQLLQHFVAHPEEAEGSPTGEPWWQGIANDPTQDQTADVFHTAATVAADAAARRASEPNKPTLERLYTDLEALYERQWRSTVNTQFIIDSTIWAGIFGLMAGAVGGPAGAASTDGERTKRPEDWALATLGSIALAAVGGALLTALLTFLGTLVGDGATGSAVLGIIGMFGIALAGGAVGSVFIGRAVGTPI